MSKPNSARKRWLISQAELETWLDGLAQAQTLIAPREISGVALYHPGPDMTKNLEWAELIAWAKEER